MSSSLQMIRDGVESLLLGARDRFLTVIPRGERGDVFSFLLSVNNQNTRKAYFFDLLDYFEFLKTRTRKTYRDVDLDDVSHFSEVLRRYGLGNKLPSAESTIKRKITAVSKFYTFQIRKKKLSTNPCRYVERPKVPLNVKTESLSVSEVKSIMSQQSESSLKGKMHKALLSVLFSTGIRVGELTSLCIGDFDRGSGRLKVHIRKSKIDLVKNLTEEVVHSLISYLDACFLLGFDDSEEMPLFRRTKTREPESIKSPLSQQGVYGIVMTYAKKAGIDRKIGPHSGRVFYITEGLRSVSVGEMARDVGHSTSVMTNEYDKRKDNRSHDIAENLGIF